jgi:hypothetical protein
VARSIFVGAATGFAEGVAPFTDADPPVEERSALRVAIWNVAPSLVALPVGRLLAAGRRGAAGAVVAGEQDDDVVGEPRSSSFCNNGSCRIAGA